MRMLMRMRMRMMGIATERALAMRVLAELVSASGVFVFILIGHRDALCCHAQSQA